MSAEHGEQRRRPVWPFALGGAALLVLVWVATASPVFVVGEPYGGSSQTSPTTTPRQYATPPVQVPPVVRYAESTTPAWVLWTNYGIAGLAVAVGLIMLVRWLLARRLPTPPAAPPPASAAQEVLADADAQLAILDRGPVDDAIIACWQRLEAAIGRAGTPVQDWETPAEVTRRVLVTYDVDDAALTTLTQLYREARFSAHRLGEPERARAAAALERLHDGLAAGLPDDGARRS